MARCRSAEAGARRPGREIGQHGVQAGRQRARQLGADHGRVPDGGRVDAPQHLKAPPGVGGALLPRELPGRHEGGVVRGRADQEPFPAQRRVSGNADGQRRGVRPGGLAEVGEDDHDAGGAGQLLPSHAGLTVKALLLESGEQRRLLGSRAAFVLHGPGDGQQRGLAEILRHQAGMTAAQAGEDGQLGFGRAGGRLADGGLQAHAGRPQPQDLPDERGIALRVTAVPPA